MLTKISFNYYLIFRHVMEIEVVLLPSLPSEIFVDLGSSADLSCLSNFRDDIEVTWQKDYKDVLNFNTHTDMVRTKIRSFLCTITILQIFNSLFNQMVL